ncbi:hypothetical protein G7Z17_g294 [Cylindrodendrum hubeiense]|uniref:Tautomerase cis-CaaD-like domain-containing protein n=1 Tax=Cylindrodendrum hubeiense TaxID=595255 RepID=A0A9P5HLU2_9HYPO|nr:hypothetical protein G7Z17_g294 [Cylindrodendrum hubeiense]
MPLWLVYHPPAAFSTEEAKKSFAEDVTNVYMSFLGLPSFYVVVQFVLVSPSTQFVGATTRDIPFIRITIDHVAVHTNDNADAHRNLTSRIDATLKPHIEDQGYDWEYTVNETPRGLWKINGLIPPPHKSAAEQLWVREDKPVMYEGGQV